MRCRPSGKRSELRLKTNFHELSAYIKRATSCTWQSEFTLCGAWDPSTGTSVERTFSSTSPTTGIKDQHLDKLLAQAVVTTDPTERDKAYQELAKYLSDQAYGVFGFAAPVSSVAVQGVHGPGLTTKIPALVVNPGIIWSEVWTDG